MMKTFMTILVSAALASAVAQADDTVALQAEARAQIKPFAGALQSTLKQGMESDGPVHAIGLCNTEAPLIAEQTSRNGWQIGRTSLKVRNPDNRPDAWEREVLQQFERRKQAGEDLMTLEASATENGEFRFMKAIPTGAACIACHGTELSAPVQARLAELYPQDQARGFNPGDLRG